MIHQICVETPAGHRYIAMMTASEFQAWLKAMRTSGAEAGRLLGIAPNTVTRYRRKGAPKIVALACSALLNVERDLKPTKPPEFWRSIPKELEDLQLSPRTKALLRKWSNAYNPAELREELPFLRKARGVGQKAIEEITAVLDQLSTNQENEVKPVQFNELSVRARNAIRNFSSCEYDETPTPEEISAKATLQRLKSFNNVGEKTIGEIENWLFENGFLLRDEDFHGRPNPDEISVEVKLDYDELDRRHQQLVARWERIRAMRDEEKMTFKDIAESFNLTTERIRQIYYKYLRKLRVGSL